MRLFRNIPSGKDFWVWPPTVAALVAIAAALAVSAVRVVIRERAIAQERALLGAKIQELGDDKVLLEEAISALGSPEAVERLAKEQLNLKRPGEEVVVVVTPGAAATSTARRSHWFLPTWVSEFVDFLVR